MKKQDNGQQTLPIDTFIKDDFPFADIMLALKPDALKFLMRTTNGRSNFQYYVHLLATMTVTEKTDTVRGIEVPTHTCQRKLPITSLLELWGMERKQGRNLLDKMEQLNLIKRISDTVTSVVDIVSVCGFHADSRWFKNPSYINKRD